MAARNQFHLLFLLISLFFLQANATSSNSTENSTSQATASLSATPTTTNVATTPTITATTNAGATTTTTAGATTTTTGGTAGSTTNTVQATTVISATATAIAGTSATATTIPGSSAVINASTATSTSAASTSAAVTTPTTSPGATTATPQATAEAEIVLKVLNQPYIPTFSNLENQETKNFTTKFEKEIREVLKGVTFTIKFNNITQGSVIVNFLMSYTVNKSVDLVSKLTSIVKSGKLGNFTLDTSYIKVKIDYPGCKLADWKLDSDSYLGKCCKGSIGLFKITRTATGKCGGITLEKDEDCGKAQGAPTCKACSLTNISTVVMMLGLIASKLLFY